MIIAIPLADGKLSLHFGHCEKFALFQIDPQAKEVKGKREIDAPSHEPGLLPTWLAERGVNLVICGGIGVRAKELFKQKNIEIIIGAPDEAPEAIVSNFLSGCLKTGANICDH